MNQDAAIFSIVILANTPGIDNKLLDSTDGSELWSAMGVSENIIEASRQLLIGSIEYKFSKD